MRTLRAVAAIAGVAGLVAIAAIPIAAGSSDQSGRRGQMMMGDASHHADMQVFHYLLENRGKITRTVTNLPRGIDTVTTSEDAEVAAKLKGHVASMAKRMDEGRPIHARDPFFAELFRHAKAVTIKVEPLPTGVRVIETSDDEYTVKLLQEHARIVNLFLENGMAEMHRDHPLPPRPDKR